MTINPQAGIWIAAHRQQQGLTQKQLAQKIKNSTLPNKPHQSAIATAEVWPEKVSFDVLYSIAKALGLDPSHLRQETPLIPGLPTTVTLNGQTFRPHLKLVNETP
jgi:transcriptional regulator with XRE-family HTH domain